MKTHKCLIHGHLDTPHSSLYMTFISWICFLVTSVWTRCLTPTTVNMHCVSSIMECLYALIHNYFFFTFTFLQVYRFDMADGRLWLGYSQKKNKTAFWKILNFCPMLPQTYIKKVESSLVVILCKFSSSHSLLLDKGMFLKSFAKNRPWYLSVFMFHKISVSLLIQIKIFQVVVE